VSKYQFLSPEWREAVRAILAEHAGDPTDQPGVTVNAFVTGVPFGEGALALCSERGPVMGWEPGSVDHPDFTIRVDYATVRELVLDTSANRLELAIGSGDIEVDGDFGAFRDWWESRVGDPDTRDLEAEVRAITA
jgi:hypothetical protein